MKKKLLIVSDSLNMGGLEKCLINLCDNLDYEKYEVDLYLFNEGRTLLKNLNTNVNLLPDSPYYKDVYNTSVVSSIKTLLKKGKVSFAWYRFMRFIRIRFKDYKYRNADWEIMQKTMLQIDKKYDIAIGFAEGTACYYVANCIQADVKIGWIHTDLKCIEHNWGLDEQAFKKMKWIVTVSQNSLSSLIEMHPNHKEKFKCIKIPALLNIKKIEKLSKESNDMNFEGYKILSLGRLVELKGFHLCVPVCRKLLDAGYKIKWYIVGEGPYRDIIEKEIENYKLQSNFVLLGNSENPYTYMATADICVQPSSYEGFSVAVFEEKYFKKPVVVTNIPSNFEMITNKENGVIVERSVEDIFNGVKYLLDNPEKSKKMAQMPVNASLESEKIMEQIESLFQST